jgi:hypothetical protein
VSRHAVVVGINKYTDSKLIELHGAENDAREVMERLRDDDYTVEAFLGENATFSEVRQAVSRLFYRMDPQDLALFYFSGHGFVDSFGDGYIATFDVECAAPWVRGISMQDVKSLLHKSKNKKAAVVILDCCYSGKATEGDRAPDEAADLSLQFRDVAETFAGSGKVIIASSGKDQKSREQPNLQHTATGESHCHGLFTYQVLEGLDLGATSDAKECRVSLKSLMDFVQTKMPGENRPTLYCSNYQNPDEIIILNTSRRSSLRPDLAEIALALENYQGPMTVYSACQTLGRVLKIAPLLPEVCELREKIEERIRVFKENAGKFLKDNSNSLMQLKADPNIVRKQKDFVYELKFEAFVGMDGSMLSDLDSLDRAQRDEITLKRYCAETLRSQNNAIRETGSPAADRTPLVQGTALRTGQ